MPPVASDLSERTEPGNVLTIVAHPDLDLGGDGVDAGDAPLAPDPLGAWVDAAFAHGYERYVNWIGPLLDKRSGTGVDGDEELQSRLPSLVVGFLAEWRQKTIAGSATGGPDPTETIDSEEIVFDGDLLATLLEIYLIDGWQPLATIGRELDKKLARLRELQRNAPSAGTPAAAMREIDELAPWEPVEWLFRLARNGIGLLIREELARLEAMAALRLQSQAAQSQTEFALHEGPLEWENVEKEGPLKGTGEMQELTGPRLKKRELADELKQALEEPVRCRRQLDLTLKELARARLQRPQPADEGGTGSGPGGAGGSSGAGGAGGGGDSVVTLQTAVEQARKLADISKEKLAPRPLLFLVLPWLKPGFTTSGMEVTLYTAIEEVKVALAELRDLKPGEPHTRGPDVTKQTPLYTALESAETVLSGVEDEVAQLAIDRFSNGDITWFPLLSEKAFDDLVSQGEIDTDSLTYVVYAHYVQTLGPYVEQQAREEEASKQFWLTFSRITAAASVISMLVPALEPLISAPLWVADTVALASGTWSVTKQLKRVEGLLGQTLAESSAAVDAFGQLGELLAVRHELLDGLADDAIVILVTTIVAGTDPKLVRSQSTRWALELAQGTLRAHGFLQDMQIIFAAASGEEEED